MNSSFFGLAILIVGFFLAGIIVGIAVVTSYAVLSKSATRRESAATVLKALSGILVHMHRSDDA